MATTTKPIRLQPETYRRLTEEAARRHEDADSAAERILREHLPARAGRPAGALETLARIEALRARMKVGGGAVTLAREGRAELERRSA